MQTILNNVGKYLSLKIYYYQMNIDLCIECVAPLLASLAFDDCTTVEGVLKHKNSVDSSTQNI